jgi:hypothetical protein
MNFPPIKEHTNLPAPDLRNNRKLAPILPASSPSKGETNDDQDAATLLADFWATVDEILRERGVIP